MRWAVVTFPGSNCDMDVVRAIRQVVGAEPQVVRHTEQRLPDVGAVVLPGGFSYGDYLRSGAMASHSPVMDAVRRFADAGGIVLGICNGFQVLTESRLLPGALVANESLAFRCHMVTLEVVSRTPFTSGWAAGSRVDMPIAHGQGRYVADEQTLSELWDRGQVAFTYHGANPNGSMGDIAGITNSAGNVLGMMPHPERAVSDLLGSSDGSALFRSMVEHASSTGVFAGGAHA